MDVELKKNKPYSLYSRDILYLLPDGLQYQVFLEEVPKKSESVSAKRFVLIALFGSKSVLHPILGKCKTEVHQLPRSRR